MAGVDRPVSVADCPRCGSLCYGASILRCGHVICRKCFVFLLEVDGQKAICPFCPAPLHHSPAQSRSDLMQNLATDPVITQRVVDTLVTNGQFFCCNHPEKEPTHVCFHCDKLYCGTCRSAHRKRQTTAFHLQQKLQPAPAPSSDSIPQLSLESEIDEATRRQNENERNLIRDSLADKMTSFTDARASLSESLTDIQTVIDKLDRARNGLRTQHDMLDAYIGSINIEEPNDAHEGMLDRLCQVRDDCKPVPRACIDKLSQDVDNVLNNMQDDTGHCNETTDNKSSFSSWRFLTDLMSSSTRRRSTARAAKQSDRNAAQRTATATPFSSMRPKSSSREMPVWSNNTLYTRTEDVPTSDNRLQAVDWQRGEEEQNDVGGLSRLTVARCKKKKKKTNRSLELFEGPGLVDVRRRIGRRGVPVIVLVQQPLELREIIFYSFLILLVFIHSLHTEKKG
ncbi:uncharacterized protein [Littorina saxatilis]|uniref:uncharacterized protein n=1 Tax=Littorina saxatilis TaxID=31220 RepID=UPI0038B6AA56